MVLDIDRARIRLLAKKSPRTVKNVLALLRGIFSFGANKSRCEESAFTIQMPATRRYAHAGAKALKKASNVASRIIEQAAFLDNKEPGRRRVVHLENERG